MIRILLVEDHQIVRNGIRTLLEKEPDMEVVAEVSNANDALALLKNGLEMDMVLTDINMPGMNGIELTKMIKTVNPKLRVAILTMLDDQDYVISAFKAGGIGYILKNVSPDELVFAIRHIMLRSERYVCSELALRLLDRVVNAPEINFSQEAAVEFSRREIEVLKLVSEGYTNQEIADQLFTSKRTVEGHRQNLIDKTGVRNSSALVRYAIMNGIIS